MTFSCKNSGIIQQILITDMYEDTPLFYLYLPLAADSFKVMQEIRVMHENEKVPLKEVRTSAVELEINSIKHSTV
ncbi:hypothetical protein EO98_16810 [Methanosarcina sp. 2.H.T.1A.6]|nr:hypothetical protein EO97_10175 [Methanosarcina sp. 2.H.T.1A.15]KKG15024.1 hypothetical protein EO94_03865 [Methanosarcina sp. 2.H.T.1A.3]KKG20723.1 hypothetical protein EO96_17855 [Methanosarcina sp. 2.H.T.1A.8]KKG22040.1 hypothetical protein EO98_16810 [Methanosarcina sp. 2.H.T.1A.6]